MPDSSRIVVVLPLTLRPEFVDAVRDVDPRIEIVTVSNDAPLPDEVAGATVFYRSFALKHEVVDAVLDRAKGLEWVHVPAAGVDAALTPKVVQARYAITNMAGVYDQPVAELALAMMLAAAKCLPTYFAAQREARWHRAASWDEVKNERTLPQLMRGSTVAVLGFGGTGGTLAGVLKALGMRVLAYRRNPQPDPRADAVYGHNQLHAVLREADWVVLTLPLTKETERIIGERELAEMKPNAWLVNVGRGRLIDDDALVAALESGRIGGACLDVFTREPLPADHPYYRLPNVIMTPHIAGAFPELNDIDREFFVDELRRFVAGEPLKATIDRSKGY